MKNYVQQYLERHAILKQRDPAAFAAKEAKQAENRAAVDAKFVTRAQVTVDPIRAAMIARLMSVDINSLIA